MIIPASFFQQSTLDVASELLGTFLVENIQGKKQRHTIIDVEAYDGPHDLVSHASKGKTPRNTPMFEAGGIWYVYFVYGMHHMLNIVTGPRDYPAAILIRGIIHADGRILNGPAKLTQALGIDKKFNTLPSHSSSHLWIEDKDVVIPKNKILTGPRIGVDYAGEWAKKPYRFFLEKEYLQRLPRG